MSQKVIRDGGENKEDGDDGDRNRDGCGNKKDAETETKTWKVLMTKVETKTEKAEEAIRTEKAKKTDRLKNAHKPQKVTKMENINKMEKATKPENLKTLSQLAPKNCLQHNFLKHLTPTRTLRKTRLAVVLIKALFHIKSRA